MKIGKLLGSILRAAWGLVKPRPKFCTSCGHAPHKGRWCDTTLRVPATIGGNVAIRCDCDPNEQTTPLSAP